MAAGGFLKSMVDSIKANRGLVKNRGSLKDQYALGGDKKSGEYNVDDVNDRVEAYRRRRQDVADRSRLISKVVIGVCAIMVLVLYFVFQNAPERTYPSKQTAVVETEKDFETFYHKISGNEKLRQDFYTSGPIAAETRYKNGKKHQNSESYYPSGEQFRSALYYYDTLIVDIYLYKNGDTMKHIPKPSFKGIEHLTFMRNDSVQVSFDFIEGKIMENTFREEVISKVSDAR